MIHRPTFHETLRYGRPGLFPIRGGGTRSVGGALVTITSGAIFDQGTSTTDASNYTTTSKTFTLNRFYLMAVWNATSAGTANVISTIADTTAGTKVVFTSIATVLITGATLRRVNLWYAVCTTTVTDTLKIDFGTGNTQTGIIWELAEITNVDVGGHPQGVEGWTGAVTSTTATNNTGTATLTPTASLPDVMIVVNGADVNNAMTQPTNWTKLSDQGVAAAGGTGRMMMSVSNNAAGAGGTNQPAFVSTSTINSTVAAGTPNWGHIAVEIISNYYTT